MARDPSLNKRAPRIGLRRSAVMTHEDGTEAEVTIVDVSSGGFRLEVTRTPRVGEFVTLKADRSGAVEAQIRWALDGDAGGVFLAPVDYAEW